MRSGLARSIHLTHATVRAAALVTLAAGVVAGSITLLQGEGVGGAARNGVMSGGSAFIAWALTRELAPDHPLAAALAGVTAPWLLFAGPPDLLAAGLLILPVRIVAGTTGRDLTPVDLVALGVGAAVATFREVGVAVAVATAMAPGASASWARRARGVLVVVSVAMTAVVVLLVIVGGDHHPLRQPTGFARGLFVGGVAAGLVAAWVVPRVSSTVDSRRGGRISTLRVRLARLTALVVGVATALWAGAPGILALAPAWAALAVTGVSSIATLGSVNTQPPTADSDAPG